MKPLFTRLLIYVLGYSLIANVCFAGERKAYSLVRLYKERHNGVEMIKLVPFFKPADAVFANFRLIPLEIQKKLIYGDAYYNVMGILENKILIVEEIKADGRE